ncbi:RNA polymerase sigma factor [Massilia sp. TWR1-2-2]|uniref:RNA polymerase sigma factor n=1 Tax=Massilia sp. TWR1-2-2 TaxID=2804584 RepID=UPI003CF365CC
MIPLHNAKPGASLSDEALVALVSSGDGAAFEPLMRRYNRLLFRTARSIMHDDADAEDVLQSAYLKAFSTLPSFRGESRLATWLVRIVMNEALARVRKNQRRAEIIHLEAHMNDDQIDAQADASATRSEEPPAAAMRAQTRRLLERKIDELPESFRTVFILREVEEMTVEETSDALDIPEATVRSRHFRGRSMLRESLSREVDFALEEAFGFDGVRCNRIVAGVIALLANPIE